ncbi:chorismate mutase [Desulfocurvibacter africanus PCS]|uniref:chorismate mutase n=1 Tax=Desulfocurvibacter africanus PCS TaxID=1262666 RepID=M5PQH9_DESAF|nr:chorismate mutase [Desulfocurvibacter africanus]EMG36329.1 chorismate mutase [Desulfocurvibacter africanus PCS]
MPLPEPQKSITTQINDLDRRLAALLAERTRLLTKAATARQEKRKPLSDPEQERRIWFEWDKAAKRLGLEPRMLRKTVALLNGMAYARVGARQGPSMDFLLTPKRNAVDIDAAAPLSVDHLLLITTVAAASGQAMQLSPVALNDRTVELVKALNQAGAALSWEQESLSSRAGSKLAFEDKAIFAGDHEYTIYLLLALGLGHAGRCRFSGGADLKLLDLGRLSDILSALGARLAPLTPHTPGLPARLESGGRMASSLRLPEDCPPAFAAALATAAWTYPEGLSLQYDADSPVADALADAALVLTMCGIPFTASPGSFSVPHAEPNVPVAPELPMDRLISASVLAMPRFINGRARLVGPWPAALPMFQQAQRLLGSVGLDLAIDDTAASVTVRPWPERLCLTAPDMTLAPLALVLAAAAPGGANLDCGSDDIFLSQAIEFLEACGKPHSVEGSLIRMDHGFDREHTIRIWSAPSVEFALAAALLAFVRPGIRLANPGVLTAHWPSFWNLYNRLGTPVRSLLPQHKEPEHEPEQKPRRRIRIE